MRTRSALAVIMLLAPSAAGCSPYPDEQILSRGAWALAFEGSEPSCAVAPHEARIGTVASKGELELKADTSEGAVVECRVKPTEEGYAVAGTVRLDGQYLTVVVPALRTDATSAAPSAGSIELATAKSDGVYRSDACSVYLVDDELVDDGKVWASFHCPTITGAYGSSCGVTEGTFAFDLCDGTESGVD